MDTAAGVLNNPERVWFANGNKYYTVSVTMCKLFFFGGAYAADCG